MKSSVCGFNRTAAAFIQITVKGSNIETQSRCSTLLGVTTHQWLLGATGFQGCLRGAPSLSFFSRGLRWQDRTRSLTDTDTCKTEPGTPSRTPAMS